MDFTEASVHAYEHLRKNPKLSGSAKEFRDSDGALMVVFVHKLEKTACPVCGKENGSHEDH